MILLFISISFKMKLRVSHICFKNWKQKEKSEESANLKIDEFYAAEEIKK